MTGLLAKASLRWEPLWSRLSPGGTIAVTVGRAHMEENGAVTWRGSYATVWRRDGDRWKVVFDVGRDQPAAAP